MQRSLDRKHRWGVILSGGDGIRLRPLTRLLAGDDRPKQFCRLAGEETLLGQTRRRVAEILPEDQTLYVLTKAHEPFYAAELGSVPPSLLVVQPLNRGTLPAILWSLMRLVRLDQKAVVAFFPSDHHFADEKTFVAEVLFAFERAEATSDVILLGAASTAAEIGYGWIEPDPAETSGRLLRIKRFWEKPSHAVAQTLLDQGCLWNTFVMVGRANSFLELIRSTVPRLCEIFRAAVARDNTRLGPEAMTRVYEGIETADFSRRVLSEAAEKLSVLSLRDVGWNDLGDPGRVSVVMSRAPGRKPAGFVAASDSASAAAV
jgi:mannose-1-phosphate guanylyltransferase